jgi:uncharacterized protein YaeQ
VKIRSSIHLDGESFELSVFSTLQETLDHLVLKLAASIFFHALHPTIETGATHHALSGQDFWPDLMAADLTGQVTLWIECGKTTLHKLEKVSKRFRQSRLVVLTAEPHQGQQQAEEVQAEGLKGIEVWSFDYGEFARWKGLTTERNDIIGEATENSMNLVINNEPFMTELKKIL